MLNDIETEAKTMSQSRLRHRPIAPDTRNTQVRVPRASRTRKPRPYMPDESHLASPVTSHVPEHTRKASRRWLIYLVLGGLLAMVLLWVGQILWNWGSITIEDLRYGRPRTTQIDHFVGHEINNIPSHFIALNLNGQIYVIEIPGGSTGVSHLLIGPHLVGPDADLAPVSLSFPGDPHHPDLLISVDTIQTLFHNTGSSYVPVVAVKQSLTL